MSRRNNHESETTIHFGKRLRGDPEARAQYEEMARRWSKAKDCFSDSTSAEKTRIPTKDEPKP